MSPPIRAPLDGGAFPDAGPWERRAWLAAMLAASVGLWAALTVVPLLPTNDGPQHIMMAHIENHYEDAGTLYRHFLVPATQFAGRGFGAVFVPLESVLPWRTALRITLGIFLIAWAWGFAALVMTLDRRRRWLALLGFVTAFQWTLYMGFFAFVIGSACGLLLVALAVATPRWTIPRMVILAFGFLLQSFLHIISALLTGMVIGLIALARGEGWRDSIGQGARVAAAGIPMGVLFLFMFRDRPGLATIPYSDVTEYAPLLDKLHYIHRCFQPGADFRGIVIAALVLVALGRLVVRRRRPSRVEWALAGASLLLLGLGVFAPERLPGWQFFYQRFLPLGSMLALALVDVERLPAWARRAGAVAMCGYTVASLVAVANMNRKLYARSADVYAGLDQPIRRHGPRLPVVRDPWASLPARLSPVPRMVPLHGAAALFVTQQGGILPTMFMGFSSVHQFVPRDYIWDSDFPVAPASDALQKVAHLPPRSPERLKVLEEAAFDGAAYEDIIMVSDPVDAELFRQRGYADDYQRGELYLAHYRGCDVEVALPPVAGLDAIEYGWWPREDGARRMPLDKAQPAADGKIHVGLPGAPCGALWVRVHSVAGSCHGAGGDGRLVARATAGARTTIACDL